jgi:uncharacterized protein YaaN involved in tellurite resistance
MNTKELLQQHFEELRTRKAAIEAILEPLRNERNGLQRDCAPIEKRMRELANQMKVIREGNKLYELDNELAACARALGARSIKAEGI